MFKFIPSKKYCLGNNIYGEVITRKFNRVTFYVYNYCVVIEARIVKYPAYEEAIYEDLFSRRLTSCCALDNEEYV